MMKRKDAVVRQLTTGILGLFRKNGIEHIPGSGRLLTQNGELHEVEVTAENGTTRRLTAPRVLLATGSEVTPIPTLPFDGRNVISSTEALALPEVPRHLVVVGGGVIGLELGSVWLRLGAKVTVIEFQDRLIPMMDAQLSTELQKILIRQGMQFHLGSKCLGAKVGDAGLTVDIENRASGEKQTVECDKVLVATGRRPHTEGLNLEAVGLSTDRAGRLEVNNHYETKTPGIFAVGDLIAGPMLAHKAEEEGVAAVDLMKGHKAHVNYGAIPGVVYTWPEVASVGPSEEELKNQGVAYRAGVFPFMPNGRARAMDETEGFAKILADAQTDRILAVHILGPRASDMIAQGVALVSTGATAHQTAEMSHAHPTLPEVIKEAALAAHGRAIHL
jgi:dihydrolipoamide dehydrogenase